MTDKLFTIRKATHEDADSLWEMQLEFLQNQELEQYRTQTKEGFQRDLFGTDAAAHALLLEIEENGTKKFAGYLQYFYGYSTGKGKRVHIEDLYIRNGYRNKGYGKSMIQEIATVAYPLGTKTIALDCLNWNERAMKFYNSLGFVEDPTTSYRLPADILKNLATSRDSE